MSEAQQRHQTTHGAKFNSYSRSVQTQHARGSRGVLPPPMWAPSSQQDRSRLQSYRSHPRPHCPQPGHEDMTWWCPAEFAGQGRSKEKNLWLSKRTEVKNILTSSGSEDCKHAHSFWNVWIHKSERAFGFAAIKAAVVSRWFLRTLEETQWWVQVLQVDWSYSVVKWTCSPVDLQWKQCKWIRSKSLKARFRLQLSCEI